MKKILKISLENVGINENHLEIFKSFMEFIELNQLGKIFW